MRTDSRSTEPSPASTFIFATSSSTVAATTTSGHSCVSWSYSQWLPKQHVARDGEAVLAAERRVEFAARDRKLLEHDAPVQQLPRIRALLPADLRDEVVRVEAGDERHRADALAAPVEPERGLRRHQRQPVRRLARLPVVHAGGVVPLPVEMRDARAVRGCGIVQLAVGVLVRTVQQHRTAVATSPRASAARTRSRSPLMPPLAMITFSAVRFEVGVRALEPAATPGHTTVGHDQRIDAVLEAQFEQVAIGPCEQVLVEDHLQFVPGAPDDVPARHRVARRVQAALDPQRHRHELDADATQPVVDLGLAALHVGFGPRARPVVFRAEFGEGVPVAQTLLDAVANAIPLSAAGCPQTRCRQSFPWRARPCWPATSRSSSSTRRPRSSNSMAAVTPAMPAPMTITSAA